MNASPFGVEIDATEGRRDPIGNAASAAVQKTCYSFRIVELPDASVVNMPHSTIF